MVDQSTTEALNIRALADKNADLRSALGLDANDQLPISTLRGAFIDNREWLANPATPAIVVGTVDMVGSRLLFSGYGVSTKMRPYQAGLLGADALVMLDEAHLVPPFEKSLACIADGSTFYGPSEAGGRALVPPFRLLALSATGRSLRASPAAARRGRRGRGSPR